MSNNSLLEFYNEQQAQPDYFGDEGWRECSPKSLRGHIGNAHFQARTLAHIGVPLYDIEIAEYRKIGLGRVVKRAYENLLRSDDDIQAEIDDQEVTDDLSVEEYRLRLVKSIRVIADKGMAIVPWDKIDAVYPDASQVTVDLDTDAHDVSFLDSLRNRTTYFGMAEPAEARPSKPPYIPDYVVSALGETSMHNMDQLAYIVDI